jgi:hypothetical protein
MSSLYPVSYPFFLADYFSPAAKIELESKESPAIAAGLSRFGKKVA